MKELYTTLIEIMELDFNGELNEAEMVEALQCTASTFSLQFDDIENLYNEIQGLVS